MESLRSPNPLVVYGIRSVGLALVMGGAFRVVRASSLAARRGPAPALDTPRGTAATAELVTADRKQSARDLTDRNRGLADFNRISGALMIVAGAVLLTVAFVAW